MFCKITKKNSKRKLYNKKIGHQSHLMFFNDTVNIVPHITMLL
jgi:hypothetical protein